MKKFVFIGFMVGAGLAVAAGAGTSKTAAEIQAASRASPTAASFTSSASLSLNDVEKFRVSVCTLASNDAPQASGTLKAWLRDTETGFVSRDKLLDLDLSSQAAPGAGNCITFPDQSVGVPTGDLMYAASSLLLTDGGTLTTQSDGGLDAGAFVIRYIGWSKPR